ncbi:MAG: hypothetical protein ACI39C_08995, partial [Dietzia sp.]
MPADRWRAAGWTYRALGRGVPAAAAPGAGAGVGQGAGAVAGSAARAGAGSPRAAFPRGAVTTPLTG